MQFTSSVGFSTNETPLTLEWAEKNFELVFQGMLDKHFLINRQADCFLSWNMDDEGNEWWQKRHRTPTSTAQAAQAIRTSKRNFDEIPSFTI